MQPPFQPPQPKPLDGVRHVIAVSSCKGGVGKSTVASNLAVTLARRDNAVGLMDADIHGPSVHIMMGVSDEPESKDNRIIPRESHGLGFMSLGLIAGEDTPVIWRGPIVGRMIQQFMLDVEWGSLDYLIVDLPPGTGDAQLTLAQSIVLSGALLVTTPQTVSLEDVVRGGEMFLKVDVPLIGVVENMSYFQCPDCDDRVGMFGDGGGELIAEHFQIPLLGRIPIVQAVMESGDAGCPIVLDDPSFADAFTQMAGDVEKIVEELADEGPTITIE